MNTYVNELQEFLISKTTGKLSSLRCRPEYFIKNNKIYLLDYLDQTYPDTWSLRDKINACIKLQITNIPLCTICQQNHRQIVYRSAGEVCLSNECSKECTHIASGIRLKTLVRDEKIANEKRKQTLLKKYGVEYNSQRPEIKKILQQPKINKNVYEKLNDKEWLYNEYITNKKTAIEIATELNVYYGTVLDYCRKHDIQISYYRNVSKEEKQINDWLQSYSITTELNVRNIITPYEIDIYLPDYKIGIELDGLQWHSYNTHETQKEINKHLNKTLLCYEQGIQLIHITDWDWRNKNSIIKSMILFRLNKIQIKIDARKCTIVEISNTDAKEFLRNNHIQGEISSLYKIGLLYNNELVSLLCIGKSRQNRNYQYEILRFCTKTFTNVRGGFSKLFKYFCQKYNPASIITYADRMFGEGNVYQHNGFEFLKSTKPGYFWTDGYDIKISRYRTQNKNISKLNLKNYNNELSEFDNMINNKFRRFWDCGNNVYYYLQK
jgi:very-short-patch-repair endonuclease